MDDNKKPISRKKNVREGSGRVERRQETSGASNGATRSSAGPERSAGGLAAGAVAVAGLLRLLKGRNGKLSGVKLILVLAIAAVAVFLLYKSGILGSIPGSVPQNDPVSPGGVEGGVLDTTVSKNARTKYTSLQGGGRDTVTVMVYMCGTDLESGGGFASKDLREMMDADISDKVNVLVFTGGCKKWSDRRIRSDRNQIFRVTSGDMEELWSGALQPMTDPDTLSGFIRWAKKNCPATRYELILWDHGGGSVSGYGYDEVNKSAGSMTLDGVAKALRDSGCKFDIVGFDACLMATLETALVAETSADYLLASEETEPGCGWYYTGWLTALSENTSLSTPELGKKIADDFVSVCGQVAPRQQATLSLIDLAELHGTVPESFSAFSKAASQSIRSQNYQYIATARGNTKEFAESSNIDQIDLIHLCQNMNTSESRALQKVLESAVKYNVHSSNIQNANGVSIYFPYGKTSSVSKMASIYEKIDIDRSYTDCIRSFASLEVAGQAAAGGSSGQMDSLLGLLSGTGSGSGGVSDLLGLFLGGSASGRSLAEVGLTEEEAAFLDYDLIREHEAYLKEHRFDSAAMAWTEKDGQKVLNLSPEQRTLVDAYELSLFVKDGEGYLDLGLDSVFELDADGNLVGAFDGTWLTVNGRFVSCRTVLRAGDAGNYKLLYAIPALLNGERVDLIACFTSENEDGEILGAAPVYDGATETETIAKGLWEIKNGDQIDFLCDYYDLEGNYEAETLLGETLTVDGALELYNLRMENDTYIAAYRVTDIYQNHYWTPEI